LTIYTHTYYTDLVTRIGLALRVNMSRILQN